MGRTFVRQETQVRNSDSYDDTIAPSQANFETNPAHLETDLNNIRSQLSNLLDVQGGNWYDDVNVPSGGSQRGVNDLNTDLDDLETKRFLAIVQVLTDITVDSEVKATGILTAGSQPSDNDTVLIDAYTYTFETAFSDTSGRVLIGAAATDSLDNLIAAINNAGGEGTTYGTGTPVHPTVSAAAGVGDTIDAEAKLGGTQGNLIATTTPVSVGGLSWGAVLLASGAGDMVVLDDSSSEAPSDTAAIGTGLGAVVSVLAGDVGTIDLVEIAGTNALNPKNIVWVRDASTKDAITSGSQEVYGLLQAEDGVVQDDAFDDATKQVQISFVINGGSDDLVYCPSADIAGMTIEYMYPKRVTLDTIPEDAAFPLIGFADQVAAVDVTLDNAIDNQGVVPATQSTDIDLRIADNSSWAFQDPTGAVDILRVDALAAGDEVEFNVANFDVNNSSDADFLSGVIADSGGTAVNLGVTSGQVDSAGLTVKSTGAGNDLSLVSEREMFLDDANQTGSTWAQTTGIKLSDTTAEWDAFEVAFGETSLLDAIVQANSSSAVRTKVHSVCTVAANADANVSGPSDDNNLDTDLGDLSGGTFITDYDIYFNGVLLRNDSSTTGANDHDVYPGTALGDGQLKFEFKVKVSDQIAVISYG